MMSNHSFISNYAINFFSVFTIQKKIALTHNICFDPKIKLLTAEIFDLYKTIIMLKFVEGRIVDHRRVHRLQSVLC